MRFIVEGVFCAVLALPLLYMLIKSIKKRIKLNRILRQFMSSQDQYEFLLIDVRNPVLYNKKHIPGAVSFPGNEIDFLPVEDMFLSIVIYGKNKRDSRKAADYLSENGYFNIYSYGSIRHWRGPIETDRGLHVSQIPVKKEPEYEYEL